jgi:hypothetical protein
LLHTQTHPSAKYTRCRQPNPTSPHLTPQRLAAPHPTSPHSGWPLHTPPHPTAAGRSTPHLTPQRLALHSNFSMSSRILWGRSSICKCQRPPAAMQRATVQTHTVCMGLVWCEVWWGRICGGVWWSVVVWCVVWGGVWCGVGLCGVEWVDTVVTITGRRTLCSQHYVHQAGTKTQAVLDALCAPSRHQDASCARRCAVQTTSQATL